MKVPDPEKPKDQYTADLLRVTLVAGHHLHQGANLQEEVIHTAEVLIMEAVADQALVPEAADHHLTLEVADPQETVILAVILLVALRQEAAGLLQVEEVAEEAAEEEDSFFSQESYICKA